MPIAGEIPTTSAAAFTRAFAGAVRIAVHSEAPAAAAWLEEFVAPWFATAAGRPDWRIHLVPDPSAAARLRAAALHAAAPRACFALDTTVLSLPAVRDGGALQLADAERSCLLRVASGAVEVRGDPATLRWRFTALLALLEIAATRMRRRALDLHAAALAVDGRGVAILGPKGAGKTTLWLYLLGAGAGAAIANDRVFAAVTEDAVRLHGMPTAVKIRRPTLARFPQVAAGLPPVARPYLYSRDELSRAAPSAAPDGEELALSPAQLLHQLAVAPCAAAPLAVLLVPRLRADRDGWQVARIPADALPALVQANLYGSGQTGREPTLFEALDGGQTFPSPPHLAELARRVPAYHVELGRRAYDDGALAERLTALVRSGR